MASARLGEFEFLVLSAVLRLGDGAYGVAIRQDIEIHADRAVAVGAVYTTLHRLERKGFVSARFGAPVAERGGRAKKFYRVESAGRAAIQRTLDTYKSVLGGMAPI